MSPSCGRPAGEPLVGRNGPSAVGVPNGRSSPRLHQPFLVDPAARDAHAAQQPLVGQHGGAGADDEERPGAQLLVGELLLEVLAPKPADARGDLHIPAGCGLVLREQLAVVEVLGGAHRPQQADPAVPVVGGGQAEQRRDAGPHAQQHQRRVRIVRGDLGVEAPERALQPCPGAHRDVAEPVRPVPVLPDGERDRALVVVGRRERVPLPADRCRALEAEEEEVARTHGGVLSVELDREPAGRCAAGLVADDGALQVGARRDPLLPGVDREHGHRVQVEQDHESRVLGHPGEHVDVQPDQQHDEEVEPVQPDRQLMPEEDPLEEASGPQQRPRPVDQPPAEEEHGQAQARDRPVEPPVAERLGQAVAGVGVLVVDERQHERTEAEDPVQPVHLRQAHEPVQPPGPDAEQDRQQPPAVGDQRELHQLHEVHRLGRDGLVDQHQRHREHDRGGPQGGDPQGVHDACQRSTAISAAIASAATAISTDVFIVVLTVLLRGSSVVRRPP